MEVLLLATYEMGRQPFGLASPAAFLREAGHTVHCADLAVTPMPQAAWSAGVIAFHLPMHTATRMAAPWIERLRRLRPDAHIACYGLYAPLNAEYLKKLGADTVAGGEFEPVLAAIANGGAPGDGITLDRLQFPVPDRSALAPLASYAKLVHLGEERVTGYTESTRGCKHRCRHCPVVPVYDGAFRVVQAETVLADVRQQVAAGARHITFGDPDFFNGPAHAARIVEALGVEFPGLTYDVTIKVEHLLRHRALLPVLQRTGCVLITSAVESLDDRVLELLEKGHTRRDFLDALELTRGEGLAMSPTFIPFTPWTTMDAYRDLLETIAGLELTPNVASIQLALRLLVTGGSRLLELDEIRARCGAFDAGSLTYPWRHADAAMDELAAAALQTVDAGQKRGWGRGAIFRALGELAGVNVRVPEARATIPYLTEPWYC